MAEQGVPQVFDGVCVTARGDLVIVVYQKDAVLHRTRWMFDRLVDYATNTPNGLLILLVLPPTTAPPDKETRQENSLRVAKLDPHLRRLVTVPLGDSFRISVVRTVMRALSLLQKRSQRDFIADSIGHGITSILQGKSSTTPIVRTIIADVQLSFQSLGLPPPNIQLT